MEKIRIKKDLKEAIHKGKSEKIKEILLTIIKDKIDDDKIEKYLHILSQEMTYDYRRSDQIMNATYPEFLLEFTDMNNEIVLNTKEDLTDFLESQNDYYNLEKYIDYRFPNVKADHRYELQKDGFILPYVWQKIFRKDYRYNVKDLDKWKKFIKNSEKIKRNIENYDWKTISEFSEMNIIILGFGKEPTIEKFENEKKKVLFFFYYNNKYYPIFFNNKYIFDFKDLSPEAIEYFKFK